MEYGIYAVQDTLVDFGDPFVRKNDDVAIREYASWLKTAKHPTDMRLYKLGEYNPETGEIKPLIPIKMLEGGGAANE